MLPVARRVQLAGRHRLPLAPLLSALRAPLSLRFASTLTSPFTSPPITAAPQPDLSASIGAVGEPEPDRSVAYLWYNQIFPIRVGVWDIRFLLSRLQQEELLAKIRDLVPIDCRFDVRVECVEPRAKDGGAFVQLSFKVPESAWEEVHGDAAAGELDEKVKQQKVREVEAKVAKVIEKEAEEALVNSKWKPWFALNRPSRAFLVKGRPWMEDMNRFPSREIKVDYEGPDIPQEELYEIFRPYGKIHDIVPGSKSSRIIFTSTRSATSARNCLHAAAVPSSTVRAPDAPPAPTTVLRILYADKHHTNYIKDWVTGHPRIVIPLIVALLGTVSAVFLDPVREFFVQSHVEGTFDANQWRIVRWLKKETLGRLGLTGGKVGALEKATGTGIEKEREEAKEQLETWLRDVPDTFIVVTGPRGSGKQALIDEVLHDGKNVLTIDCDALLKSARSDTKLVNELASTTGYWPQFVLAASLNNMIDLAAMGLIGQKAGFSSSLDTQLKAILEVTSSALSSIATSTRARAAATLANSSSRRDTQHEREAAAEQLRTEGVRDGRIDAVAGSGVVSELGGGIEGPAAGEDKEVGDGVKVEIVGPQSAAFIKDAVRSVCQNAATEGESPAQSVERLPVVVIKSFSGKGEAKQELLYDVLSEWAAVLVENQIAHVVFTSDASTVTKPLAKVLPSRPFNVVALRDANPEASLDYVSAKLASFDQTLPATSYPAVSRLGGRQTDLELLVQKIRAGQTVDEAVDDIISREASSLRKNLFGDDEEEAKSYKWSRDQAWTLVKGLSDPGELKYAATLLTVFGGDDTALRALESASLISVHHINGRPSTILPGKPVYRSACERLLADAPFRASIEFRAVSAGLKGAAADVQSAQAELIELAKLFTGDKGKWAFGGASHVPLEVEVRVAQLLATMRGAQEKSEQLGKEKARLLAILQQAE
ncbi:hypothetical protein JCM10207_005643 [Rhodosporidiobolus poonsookiae]